MTLHEYFFLMGRLYQQGVTSDFTPGLLQQFGGSLAIAASDSTKVRVDSDSIFNSPRNFAAARSTAIGLWNGHLTNMGDLMLNGMSPTRTILTYLAKFGAVPHRQLRLRRAVTTTTIVDGNGRQRTVAAWQLATLEFRNRVQRGSRVMSDTFGGISAFFALMITAEDWQHATPAEWDNAISVGELGQAIGSVASAHLDARQQRAENRRNATVQP